MEAEIAGLGLDRHDAALVREFAERGRVIIDPEIPDFDNVAQRIKAEVAPHLARGRNGNLRAQDAWRHAASTLLIAGSDRILATLRLLYGREPVPFQTINFSQGSEQSPHSDTIHFDCSPSGFVAAVWVALEDADAGNGPPYFYPGSHLLPQLTLADFGKIGSKDQAGYDHYRNTYEPGIRHYVEALGLRNEEAHVKKGQALIWAANMLHGGSPIRDRSRTRHSQVTHYCFEGCTYFTPLLSDPLLGRTLLRHPRDIRTGRIVPSSYCGEPVRPPLFRGLWARMRRGVGR